VAVISTGHHDRDRAPTVGTRRLAVIVGQQLGARLPERTVKIGAAATVVVFGVYLIIDGLV